MKVDDELLERFDKACRHYFDETSRRCSECRADFATGDVCVVFGDLEVALVQKFYLCARCGYQAICSGSVPSATSVFIEDGHRGKKLSKLPPEVAERIAEAFQIVDRIHAHMEALVARLPAAPEGPPS